eukprot:4334101-Prymnesium_polylepis.1
MSEPSLSPLIAPPPSDSSKLLDASQRDYWAERRATIRRETSDGSSSPQLASPCSSLGGDPGVEPPLVTQGTLRTPSAGSQSGSPMVEIRVSSGAQNKLQAWAARSQKRLGKQPVEPDGSVREGQRLMDTSKLRTEDGEGVMVNSKRGVGKVRSDELGELAEQSVDTGAGPTLAKM